jgi:hypothetical protein
MRRKEGIYDQSGSKKRFMMPWRTADWRILDLWETLLLGTEG